MDSMDFLQRCQDCERALLPSDIIFPRPGQIWETLHDCEVHVQKRMIGTRGPMFGLNANLKQGERVLILPLAHTKPLQIIFQPLRYDELHQTIASGSLSYELSLMTTRVISGFGPSTGYFIELFKLVQDVV